MVEVNVVKIEKLDISNDALGIGKAVESVCTIFKNLINSISQNKIEREKQETECMKAMTNIVPSLITLPKEEREDFITSQYPKLVMYSNFNSFSKELKDKILTSYCQIHPDIDTQNLKTDDNNFKQLYNLVDLHLAERRIKVKELIEESIKFIEKGNTLSLRTVKFIETLSDREFEFCRIFVIPFIDKNHRCVILRSNIFEQQYSDLNVFQDILENSYHSTDPNQTIIQLQSGDITMSLEQIKKINAKKINQHIYELSLILDPMPILFGNIGDCFEFFNRKLPRLSWDNVENIIKKMLQT